MGHPDLEDKVKFQEKRGDKIKKTKNTVKDLFNIFFTSIVAETKTTGEMEMSELKIFVKTALIVSLSQ